ncbi:Rab geranylgeranyl transferase escort protein [Trichoderma cornu-damae]|uniref:Rab proteins geranylgeranyltransferase n=1 Tax=Trichoderma cornu-damae TaxID=654480 RepID=A0A9P8QHK9_9HYPO|nr:Rab geranylgeranyl transferase escort protein [Trichoderma cornu-damae]
MESLSDTQWDVVISGTGLQQSLLALALSRSGKNILHVDPNEYYGEAEAVLSLQEADEWAAQHQSADGDGVFAAAQATRPGGAESSSSSRAYSLALAPQLIHTRSELLSKLVSSKAFRQLEFLAVGSFYIHQSSSAESSAPSLSRIPSTREDVFANTTISVKAKRGLMKFLKFVLEYDSVPQTDVWRPHADDSLASFLAAEFKLDADLQAYVAALTLSLDGNISTKAGLAAIHRHLTSMGVFGAGFAAVYPKWGGLSEIAQVGCRAGAVGGAVYMLGVGIKDVEEASSTAETHDELDIVLTNDMAIKSKTLVKGLGKPAGASRRLSRLTAVVNSGLPSLFETVGEGAPTPAVAVVAFPSGTAFGQEGASSEYPIYALAHSSDSGECPAGQCVLYLSTLANPNAQTHLEKALSSLLASLSPGDQEPPQLLYQLCYEQIGFDTPSVDIDGQSVVFSLLPLDLAFNDSALDPVRQAWEMVLPDATAGEREEYLVFTDREGVDAEDEFEN